MDDAAKNALLRSLPSIDELLARPELAGSLAEHPRARVVAALRQAVQVARARLLSGTGPGFLQEDFLRSLSQLSTPGLVRVLNATGVVLHTNLGRAPLAAEALDRVREVASGYCNLEYDLEEGDRGSRYAPLVEHLCALSGAEAAIVVNNNAAAVLLVLSALAQGREVIISRGELVEIGGGFRIPDVMKQSGAQLVEVGTTNRTRLADYEAALTERTALVAKVHPSNFAQVGFTEAAPARELVELAHAHGKPFFEDLGSGLLEPLAVPGLPAEPTVRSVVQTGADVVTFSGDKLLGGPQAGIIVGSQSVLERIRRHPLTRAVRVDKLTVAALEATLVLYRDGLGARVPTQRLLAQAPELLSQRAERLRLALAGRQVAASVVPTVAQVGGGAMPLGALSSHACVLATSQPDALHDRLRGGMPPVIARISDGQLLLDVRCLEDGELETVVECVVRALAGAPGRSQSPC